MAPVLRTKRSRSASVVIPSPGIVSSAWNERSGRFDHFAWAIHDELATRAGMTRDEYEIQTARYRAELTAGARA